MGFDAATLVDAFGALYGQLYGTMQAHVEGSPLLALQVGFNARNALVASTSPPSLPAPQQALESEFGDFALLEGAHDLAPVIAALGGVWRAGVRAQAVPERPRDPWRLRGPARAAAPDGFTAVDVQSVVCTVPPLTARLVGRPRCPGSAPPVPPQRALRVRLALRTPASTSIISPRRRSRSPRASRSPRGSRCRKTKSRRQRADPVAVSSALDDGRRHEIMVADVYGIPARPMGREARLAKLRRNSISGGAQFDERAGEALIAPVERLERCLRRPSARPPDPPRRVLLMPTGRRIRSTPPRLHVVLGLGPRTPP